MSRDVSPSLSTVMRLGYGARGVIYTILGGLTIWAAVMSTKAQGTKDALSNLQSQPFGQILLWIIALGLFCYLVWRLCDAVLDLDEYGTDGKGIIARLGQATTGILHGALGVTVASLAMGSGSGGGGGTEDATAQLMSLEYGRYLVALAALLVVGAGIYYAYKGLSESYREDFRRTSATERLDPWLKAGLIVHGAVVVLIGVSLGFAALTTDPSDAGGLGQALSTIRDMSFGRILLGLTGLGLLGFALYNFVQAAYRIVPALAEEDVATLAKRAVS